jgi:hypothetical protein
LRLFFLKEKFYRLVRLQEIIIKIFALLLCTVILSSCVVLHEEYFYPQAEGARVEKESCRGQVGVDNQLIFPLDDVNVELHVWEYKGKTSLEISFKVYKSANVVWPVQTVTAYMENSTKNLKFESFTRLRVERFDRADDNYKIHEKEYPIGSVMDRATDDKFEIFYKRFEISDIGVEWLKISGSKVIINGKEKILSEIFFTKKSGLFLHPLNC